MTINWDYIGQAVHTSMLDYIPELLTRFQHPTPRIPQHQPYPHVKPTYGTKAQYTEDAALLRTLRQQHHAAGTRIPRNTTGKSNAKHQKVGPSTP